jgi:dolichol-phosphate mannosyltransferase
MRERNRVFRGRSAWTGFKQIGGEDKREARHAGESKYPLKKMLKLAMNAVTGFSIWPLQLATRIGIGLLAGDFIGLIVVIILSHRCSGGLSRLATLGITNGVLAGQILTFMASGDILAVFTTKLRPTALYCAEGPE